STADCAAGDSACSGEGLFTGGQLGFPVIQYPVPLYDSVTESDITPLNQYRVSLKVDHKISDHDQINGVYLLEDAKSSSNIDGGDTTFGVPLENPNRAQTASISWTHTFSPNVLNQAKIGYVRRLANFIAPGTDGIPGLLTIDALSSGFGGSTALPQFFTENEFQYKDDLSASKGRHSFKFGGEYRRTRNGSSFDSDKFGHFWSWGGEDLITDSVFSDEADLLYFGKPYYGTWYSAGAAVNPTNGAIPDFYRGYRANEFGAFGQDDWKVTPRLTMNLGVRWDYFGPPHNFQDGVDSNFYFGTGTTPVQTVSTNPYFPANDPLYAKEATGGFQQRNSNIWAKDYNNFGPRVGFSWDVFGTQKVVVRSGFGMFYDRIYNNLFENIRFNPPGYCDCTAGSLLTGVPAGAIETPGLFAVPFTANSSFIDPALFPNGLPKATPRHMDENLVAPYYEQWSFGLQYDLGHNLILETNYLGTAGRKLIGIRNINTFDGRVVRGLSTTRINSTIGSDNYRSNDYGSNYHALEATLRKQFSSGLTFNANYTWSKALDDISDAFRAKGSTAVTDPMNIHLDYGPADFDIRNRFVGSFNYDLPFMKANRFLGGWTLNGIFSINSGAAVALLDSSGDYNKNGLFGERPAYVGPGTITNAYLGKNPADGYLNPDDFGQVTCPADVNGGQWCNSTTGRGSLHGPTYVNFDFGVGKSFKITESSKLTLQGNFFDIFNHPNFQNPQGDIQSANFGKAEDTFGDNGGHRVIQLSLRFDF
ncbi:MAG TPA: hypothetical protein VH088_10580, partial [Terriglobales bacterium]|nr:hypothetical protein [Terriglobales bacterium]